MPAAPTPRLSLVAAIAANGVIGSDNAMPWHLSEDLKRFKALTLGHAVVMGRRTFESIGRPLPGRRNIVVTRNANWRAPGCETAASLDEALALCGGDAGEVFVIGGAQIYAEALPRAQRLYLTEIHRDFPGDTRFPDFDRRDWREVSRQRGGATEGFDYDFAVYDRL
ncbi:MAG TPA: dihydrofolate reductase [Candidatus Desulfobacillus sp.]|nr:dihydrofolate reductase [Candidatus Desulfobacillus sp.]